MSTQINLDNNIPLSGVASSAKPDERYLVVLNGEAQIWDANRYNKNAQQLYADHPEDALTFKLDDGGGDLKAALKNRLSSLEDRSWLNPNAIANAKTYEEILGLGGLDDEQFFVTLDNETQVWDAGRVKRNADRLMKDHPDAKISMMTYKDYWYDKALADEEAVKSTKDEIDALKAEFAKQQRWSPEANALESQIIERQSALDALQTGYDANPRVIEAKERYDAEYAAALEDYKKNYLPNLRSKIKGWYDSDVDKDVVMAEESARESAMMDGFGGVSQLMSLKKQAEKGKTAAIEKEKDDMYQTSLAFLEKAERIRAEHSTFGQGAKNIGKNWLESMGSQSDLETYADLHGILKRLEGELARDGRNLNDISEEDFEKYLSNSEKALVLSFFEYNAALKEVKDETSGWYKGGQIAAEAVPFVVEFMLTGGFSGAASKGVTKGLSKALAGWIKKAAKGTFRKTARKVIAKGARGAVRGLTQAAIITPLRPTAYTNVAKSMTQIGEDGKLKDSASDVAIAVADEYIETLSELSGGAISSILGGITKGAAKKFLSKSMYDTFATWGKRLANTSGVKLLKSGQFHGLPVEMAEEYFGNALREMYDAKALDRMHEGDNFWSMVVGFLPLTVLGAGVGIGQYVNAKNKVNKGAAKVADQLSKDGFDKDQIDAVVAFEKELSPYSLSERLDPVLTSMAKAGASKESRDAVINYAMDVVRFKTLEGTVNAQEATKRQEKLDELTGKLGTFYQTKNEGTKWQENTVTQATLYDGRTVFLTSAKNEMGEFAAVDAETGETLPVSESDIALVENAETGESSLAVESQSLDTYLTSLVMSERKATENERMANEKATQVASLQERLKADAKLNIGTSDAPVYLAYLPEKSNDGMAHFTTQDGSETILTWEQVGDYLNQPIRVLTDAQLAEAEAAELALNEAQIRTESAETNEDMDKADESVEVAVESEEKANPVHIPMNPDGTVNTDLFWDQNPEEWVKWNDEQKQDGGVDSMAQIAAGLQTAEAKLAEASKLPFATPTQREARDKEMGLWQDKINRYNALLEQYQLAAAAQEAQMARAYAAERLEAAEAALADKMTQAPKRSDYRFTPQYMQAKQKFDAEIASLQEEVTRWQNELAQYGELPVQQEEAVPEENVSVVEEQQPEVVAPSAEELAAQLDAMLMTGASRSDDAAVAAMQAYADAIASGVPAQVVTRKNVMQVLKDAGVSETKMAEVKDALRRIQYIVNGFEANGVAYILADSVIISDNLRSTYVHERQHVMTAQSGIDAALMTMTSREELQSAIAKMVGSDFYNGKAHMVLADELISMAMERAYRGENLDEVFEQIGFKNENAINFIKDIDNAQRNDSGLSLARIAEIGGNAAEGGSRQDGRTSLSGSTEMGEQGSRSVGRGGETVGDNTSGRGVGFSVSPNEGVASMIENENGDAIAETNGGGGVRFSVLTYEQGGRDYLVDWLRKSKYMSKEERDFIVATLDQQYELAKRLGEEFPAFGAWSSAEVNVDKDGNPVMSVIKANGDYSMNLDFSLICKKRRPLNALLDVMIADRMLDMRSLNEAEIAKINKVIQRHGFEVACALCFVDSKRYRVVKVATDFADLYNELVNSLIPEGSGIVAVESNYAGYEYINERNAEKIGRRLETVPDAELNWAKVDEILEGVKTPKSVEEKVAWMLRNNPSQRKLVNATDFVTNLGFESVKKNNPELLKVYNAKKGTGGPKASFGDVQYLNDILKSRSFTPAKAYSVGGVRVQSFSDYMGHMFFDYMQMMAELSAKGLPAHAYTKEEAFARIFGMTGMKINMSLVPAVADDGVAPGLDAQGNYVWAVPYIDEFGNEIQGQTFPPEVAFELQRDPRYSKNVGIIAVGVSDEHILKMLNDDQIHFVIPYHKSSLNPEVAKLTKIDKYADYTNVQNTRLGWEYASLDKDQKKAELNKRSFDFYKSLANTKDPKATAAEYLEHCRQNGLIPKYEQFSGHENYYKLLVDFNTYDFNTGEYAPQGPVTMTFPEELESLVKASVASNEELESDLKDKVGKMAEDVKAELGGTRFSAVTPQMDADYLAAVERGDMETAQRMVLEAAKLAMPNTKVVDENGNPLVLYHGSPSSFTVFDIQNFGKTSDTGSQGKGFYFTSSQEYADRYRNGNEQGMNIGVFLNLEKPLVMDDSIDSQIKAFVLGSTSIQEVYERIDAMVETNNASRSDAEEIKSLISQELIDFANEQYDGVIPSNFFGTANEFVALHPNQIKSADPVTYDDNGNIIPLSERFNPEKSDIRFSARTDEQRQALFDKAKAQFGLTNNFNAAGYMLPDGSLLDFSEANDGGDPNKRSQDHREIEGIIMDEGKEYDSRWMYLADFMNEGAIRLLPEYAGINLMKAPTKEQRQRLFDFIYKYNGEVILEIADERLNNVAYVEYDRRTSPSRIFRDIDGYFNEGIVPQQDTRFSASNNNQTIFVSNAAKAVEGIKQEKATPAQWLAMLEKNGGLKAAEDKWMGLSDWLKASDKKTLTKAEVLDFINENKIQIEEVHYDAYAEERASDAHSNIVGVLQNKFNDYVAEYHEEHGYEDEYDDPASKYAIEKLREEMEDTFPYTIELVYGNEVYVTFDYEEEDEMVKWAEKTGVDYISGENPINSTRLNYTTDGLNNKHEIALTIPTIDPYQTDDVHFTDAGDGRAVAWIRFGETTDEEGKRVLVIDEIQSKRHQEGREKGYAVSIEEYAAALEDFQNFNRAMREKYGANSLPADWSDEDQAEFNRLRDRHSKTSKSFERGIPDAPFEKNWHELAMKRMLRYAAENGYDVVAWTKGEQQADRYNLGKIYNEIEREDNPNIEGRTFSFSGGNYDKVTVNEDGVVVDSTIEEAKGKPLSDLVGKDLAVKMMSLENYDTINGEELRIGGEGMKGFYDKMLPAFMNKYGKKWGIKVEDINLPNLEDGLTMHSVPVTEEMKASVMEGQTMFSVQLDPAVRAEMDVIKATAMVNGNYMKAPNGQPTKLTEDQWALVRTKNFKNWFGDWENDPENASKVVDENGEPKVVYHGTKFGDFYEFKHGKETTNSIASIGYWFSPEERFGERFAAGDWRGTDEGRRTMHVFLNIRNPKVYESESYEQKDAALKSIEDTKTAAKEVFKKHRSMGGTIGLAFVGRVEEEYNTLFYGWKHGAENSDYFYNKLNAEDKANVDSAVEDFIAAYNQFIEATRNYEDNYRYGDSYEKFKTDIYKEAGMSAEDANAAGIGMMIPNVEDVKSKYVEKQRSEGFDGIVIKQTRYDKGSAGGSNDQYVTFDSSQIKSATETTGLFSESEDIRFSAIKEVNAQFNQRLAELEADPTQKDRVLHLGRPSVFLMRGGVRDAEILLEYDKFVRKSAEAYKNDHPFTAKDITDLPLAIYAPIASFNSTNGREQIILTELKKDGNNFVVVVRATRHPRKGGAILEVNDIQTLYPKKAKGIINWILTGKTTQMDTEKALNWIGALQTHLGTELSQQELSTAAKVVKDFVNPNLMIAPEQDKAYMDAVERGDMEAAQRMVLEAAKLAMPNTKVVDENGNPKVVYHGTGSKFYTFRDTSDSNELGAGYYFSDSYEMAERYATDETLADNRFRAEALAFDIFTDEMGHSEEDYDDNEFIDDYNESYAQAVERLFGNGHVKSVFLNLENPRIMSRNSESFDPTYRYGYNHYNEGVMAKRFNDGIIDEMFEERHEGLTGTQYVAFNPAQIKSADPVTYDDEGNVIPLSERFNPEKKDIRFSAIVPHESSMDEIDQMFASWNRDPFVRDLYAKVSDLAHKMNLKIKFVEPWSEAGGSNILDKVKYNVDYFNSNDYAQTKAGVLLHELIHSVTVYAVAAKNSSVLTQEMKDAVKQMEAIYDEIKDDPAFDGTYGAESVKEMVSELSNPRFRQKLRAKNLLQRIIDAIKHLLGIDKGTNALDNLEGTLEYMIENFDQNAFDAVLKANEQSDYYTRFSVRTKPAPKEVKRAYKLFNVDGEGKPHALFIDGANALDEKVWYDADSPLIKDLENLESGYTYFVDKDGNAERKTYKNKKQSPSKEELADAATKGGRYIYVGTYANGEKSYYNWGVNGGKNGGSVSQFAMRPGWHLTDSPSARHIGAGRNPEAKQEAMYRKPNQRWFEVEYAADVDYNEEAKANPTGDIQTHIPDDGYYSFKTNTAANDVNQNWIISGAIRIVKPLTREQVSKLNEENGVPDDLDYENGTMFSVSERPVDEIVNDGVQKVSEEGKKAKASLKQRMDDIDSKLYYVMRMVAAAQKNYDKKTVDIMTNLAKELMRDGALSDPTRGEINRLLSAIKNATGKADLTAAATTLMDVMVSNQLRHAKNTLAQMLSIKAKKVNASGVEVQGTLDLVGQRLIATVKESVGLTLEKIDERIADAKEKMDSEFDTIKNNAAIDLVGLNIARKYVDGVVASEAEEKDLRKELENAQEDKKAGKMTAEGLREFRKATEDAIRQNRMERTSAYRNILSEMAKLITESVTKAGQFRDAEKERIEKIHHYANSDMQGMDDAEHVNNDQRFTNNPILRFFLEPLGTMDQMLRQIGSKHVNGEGYLWNHYMRGWLEATEKEYLGVSAAHKALDAKANEVFGVKRWSDMFSIVRSLPSMHVEFWDGSKMRDHVLTQGNLLYIYMVNKMSDGKMKLRRMGIEEGQVHQMAMFMDPRLIEVGEWLQNEFLPSLRDKYNAVHEKMFGAPMAAIDSYFPIRVQANARTREVDVATPEAEAKASTITGAIIKRTKNSLALDVLGSDALDVVLGHIQEMEHWAAFAEWNRDLNTLLSYKKFRNKVQNMSGLYGSGATAWNNFRKACEVAAGVYKPASSVSAIDKTALNLAKGVTAGKISFRVFTAIKQLLSMPAFVSDANMMELSKSIATPWESWNWAMKELPLFQKRWLSRQAGDSRLMATESDWKLWKNSIVEAASRYGMAPNAFVDALTVSIGAKAIYETKLAKYIENGYSVDAAEKKAKQDATILFNESQQSNEGAFLSSIQVDRTWVSAALTVFRNSSMGYQRMLVDALRNIKHRMSKGYKDESIEFMAKQMVRDGLSESQAQRAAERMYNRGFWHNMMRVGTFGFLVQFAWNLGAYLPYLVLGADDDEKEKMLKDAATHALLGGFVEGLSGGSLISEASNLVASGKGLKDYDPSLMPIVSDMKRLVQLWSTDVVAAASETMNLIVQMAIGVNPQTLTDIGVAIYDACDGDPQTAREATLLLARILQVPQSQTEQIYIDEIDFTVDKALDLTIEEFAQRYATYKRLRNAPITGLLYSDEEERKVEDRYIKRFTKRAEELKRTRGNEEAKAWYNYVDNEYKEVDKTIRELRSGAEKAAKREDRVSVEEFAARLQELMQTPEFERYQQRVGKVKAVEKLRQAMKDYPTKRDMLEDRMLEIRKQLVEEMQQAE